MGGRSNDSIRAGRRPAPWRRNGIALAGGAASALLLCAGASAAPTDTFPFELTKDGIVRWLAGNSNLETTSIVSMSEDMVVAVVERQDGRGVARSTRLSLREEIINPDAATALGGRSVSLNLDLDCARHRVILGSRKVYSRPNLMGSASVTAAATDWAAIPAETVIDDVADWACRPPRNAPANPEVARQAEPPTVALAEARPAPPAATSPALPPPTAQAIEDRPAPSIEVAANAPVVDRALTTDYPYNRETTNIPPANVAPLPAQAARPAAAELPAPATDTPKAAPAAPVVELAEIQAAPQAAQPAEPEPSPPAVKQAAAEVTAPAAETPKAAPAAPVVQVVELPPAQAAKAEATPAPAPPVIQVAAALAPPPAAELAKAEPAPVTQVAATVAPLPPAEVAKVEVPVRAAETAKAAPAAPVVEVEVAQIPAPTPAAEAAKAEPAPSAAAAAEPAAPAPSPAQPSARVARAPVVRPQRPPGVVEFAVQIAAQSSESLARQSWEDLKAQHSDVATSQVFAVEPVSANGRTLYRALLLGFKSRDEAAALCQTLKSQSVNCILRAMR